MYDFIEDILDEARSDMNETFKLPANGKLFDIETTSKRLNVPDQDYFHWMVARLLFATKRAQPDIQVVEAFLCTKVGHPTQQDYKKLTTIIKYLYATVHLSLLIGWDESGVPMWSVDGAFAVHQDMRSHTGAALTMGKETLLSLSMKQKINTKSSTEAELVGVDDVINFVVWSNFFFDWQFKDYNPNTSTSYLCKTNILLQDNISTIQLERYRKRSSTKHIHHILIRYFYVTDISNKTMKNLDSNLLLSYKRDGQQSHE